MKREHVYTKEEEKNLIFLAQCGDEESLMKLYDTIKGFISSQAKLNSAGCYINEKEDLESQAWFGFMDAIRKFDLDRDCYFITYAGHYIIQSMRRYRDNTESQIRQPVPFQEKLRKIKKVSDEYYTIYGEYPTIDELVKLTGFTRKVCDNCLSNLTSTTSLDAWIETDGDGYDISCHGQQYDRSECLTDPNANIEKDVFNGVNKDIIDRILNQLDDASAIIIKDSYGYNDEQKTLKDEEIIDKLKKQMDIQFSKSDIARMRDTLLKSLYAQFKNEGFDLGDVSVC